VSTSTTRRPRSLTCGPGRRVDSDAESGRGINIVNAIADEVGCEQVEDDGKIIFASFDIDRHE